MDMRMSVCAYKYACDKNFRGPQVSCNKLDKILLLPDLPLDTFFCVQSQFKRMKYKQLLMCIQFDLRKDFQSY